ncbi:Zinc finger CCCH domain-containing protein 43 [Hordeum vulgare]|nr:Zinc finger CCCH domain-containing protein 43 [Hordeum vulgare]
MKKEYTNWMTFKNKTTGLGWNDEANTVVADDDWWKKMGEENKEFLAFRKRGPEHLDEMSRMFENVLVTGESSFMPGTISGTVLPEGAELHNLDDDDDDEVRVTPSNRGKRGAGQLENPKKKNHVQRELKRMVDHMINEDASVASSKVTIVTEIEKIMEEVVMCGAKEGSDEHYIATKLFAKLENRAFFRTFKTNDGKMNWLRRMYEDRRKN